MPSRKKAKGKARKAAKAREAEAKAKEEESRAVEVAAGQRQEESLEAQIQRLMVSASSPELCRHGYPSLSAGEEKVCEDFIQAFMSAFNTQEDVGQGLVTACDATEVKYTDVYSLKLDTVVSMLLAGGAQRILNGNNDIARLYACLASYFEEFVEVSYRKTKAAPSLTKTFELCGADDHTLVSYYRKRIPCSCLDEKYKEVKTVKKMGLCYNPSCSLPDYGRVERCKMLSCRRCGDANYCSVECQKSHWKEHKKLCDEDAKLEAAFVSKQS